MANQMTMPGSIPMGPQTTPLNSPDGKQPNMGPTPNPLQKYFRQPKVYITLPSKGMWYPPGTVDLPENGEIPVYSMTARDELVFKTPDALLNGKATVDVIQSCVPNIKDAWVMPSIDLDTVLVAIRLASYGEKLEIPARIPGTTIDKTYDLDLRMVLDKFSSVKYESVLNHKDMKITLRPHTYREFTKTALKTFEEQKLFSAVNNTDIDDAEKLKRFNDAFINLTDITVDTVANSVVQIQVGDEVVVDKIHLIEFIHSADREFYTVITDHIQAQRDKFEMAPIKMQATEEELEQGAPAEYQLPIKFDQANFFA